MRLLSPTLLENLFTTVAIAAAHAPALARAPENVFNDKADFKVLFTRVSSLTRGVRQASRRTNAPTGRTPRMATRGLRTGPDTAAIGAVPWLKRYPGGVDWRMPLNVAPLYTLLDEAVAKHRARVCTNFLGKTLDL